MTEPNRQSGENEERIIEIEIERLRPFKEHPFQVKDDKEMFLLQESIEKYGILNPLIVRPVPDGYYEIISGHRRKHAAEKLGYRKVLVIIRVLSEDDSILSMVDSNLHRERISYSEKAFAYKMKQEAMKHQGSRTDLTLGQNVPKFKRTTEAIADGTGESYKQIQRYIRLTELLPELLDLLDNKKLQFTVAVNISYIDKEIQGWIYEYISDTGFIKPKQIAALRNQLNDGPINQIQMLSIFNNCVMAKKVSRSLTFSEKKLTKYFPDDYTAKDMEQVIESLLEKWMQEQSC
ncbi:ParB/RepB/Spo0J family partition protein [Blautia wexlerae]|uniref:ParB/RepB/Spo0J family partition protein n=1 Tax=Blautia wexlerae TaxID=418240 RepID=UPI0018A965D7|nr:ParB/RepB/Spo0J family partition protein [Blautia wexlerae]MDB6457457.1 ParB/RepB/Spo0J family partition protein [Blautia wexlerae]